MMSYKGWLLRLSFRRDGGARKSSVFLWEAVLFFSRRRSFRASDLSKMTDTGTSASGIAVDDVGSIYAADVGFNNLRKYVKVQ